jgi:hypothetical protein
MAQLTTMVASSGAFLYFRCPYQAIVINMLEIIRSKTVLSCMVSFEFRTSAESVDEHCEPHRRFTFARVYSPISKIVKIKDSWEERL